MNDIIKIIISNGGLSVRSGITFVNVAGNTTYNEDQFGKMSDTPYQVGSTERALPGAVAYFARKNLR
ncbi:MULTISPECIES: hypothetical protein [Brucella/Ochrobactrum group]|uniref:Uncharacterized protein n=1 Tax=Brucella pseudintermedia TaxID=370111 RepID=A0ABY5UAK7_9HYPH|nr:MULTISPECIES: hypothetical protein [Brucella/Ochrobactrum group]KAB2680202.1 hypothetical protein F9K78_18280 [Brucella pseudintermedia]NKE77717.1 hypothetical protein [Ochrobactrum sp. MC-1LL]TWG95238.1 hypothetical protein L614_000900000730 [Ochrobactrum sp. J50]UWL59367.1 hypothetical protein NIK97_07425 [Brucella pseudintermedia]WPM79786.1 hypothetical protein R5W60_11450 [Brucella pseudintermedia]